jgi:hypothetical protein
MNQIKPEWKDKGLEIPSQYKITWRVRWTIFLPAGSYTHWKILVLHPGILWWHQYQNIVRSSSRKLKSLDVSQHLIKQLEAHNKMLAISLTPGMLHLFLSFHWRASASNTRRSTTTCSCSKLILCKQ